MRNTSDVASSILDTSGVVTRHIDRLLAATTHPDPVKLGGSPYASLPLHMLEAARQLPARSSYVDSRGIRGLRDAIVLTLATEGLRASPDRTLVTNGAMHALEVCFATLVKPGDGVVRAEPGYFIDGLVRRVGGNLQSFPSPESDGFRPDWEAAERVITPSSRVLFLNSPVNPTGYMYTEADLERAWQIANDHDLWIISDESYSHFTFGKHEHRSILELDPGRRRTILVRSFSKDYAMPGWRLGYASLPDELAEPATAHLEWTCLCVSHIAQVVGEAALTGPRDWIETFVQESERLAEIVVPAVNRIDGLHCVAPQGGLNVLVAYDGDVLQLTSRAISQFGLALQPGATFGAQGYVRFQFGGAEQAVRTGLDRLALAVGESREQLGREQLEGGTS
jgi:aspartate/methionine/tyrosine aminotransferase